MITEKAIKIALILVGAIALILVFGRGKVDDDVVKALQERYTIQEVNRMMRIDSLENAISLRDSVTAANRAEFDSIIAYINSRPDEIIFDLGSDYQEGYSAIRSASADSIAAALSRIRFTPDPTIPDTARISTARF